MDCSFQPDGRWFVFSTDDGRTLKSGFKTKAQAMAFIALQGGRQ